MLLAKVAPPVTVEISLLPADPKAAVAQEVEKLEIELEVLRPTMDGNLPSQFTSGTTLRKCSIADNQLRKHCPRLSSQLPRSSNEGLHFLSIFSPTNLLTFMYLRYE